jgi:coenzyme PQQ precursor peptide PqqA
MAAQNSSQPSQQTTADNQSESRLPVRTSADWEKPSIEELDLCLEVTAYIYHWQ